MRILIPLLLVSFSFCSCSSEEKNSVTDSPALQQDIAPATPKTDSSAAETLQVEARTFEVTDDSGMKKGWGYDLYVNGKKVIHQDVIPARSGNAAFSSEADAKKTGDFAALKYMKTGRFPSLNLQELDSLGIK